MGLGVEPTRVYYSTQKEKALYGLLSNKQNKYKYLRTLCLRAKAAEIEYEASQEEYTIFLLKNNHFFTNESIKAVTDIVEDEKEGVPAYHQYKTLVKESLKKNSRKSKGE